MSKNVISHEQPPMRKGFTPLPGRHYRRIAKEQGWESRVAFHEDLGYQVEAEMGTAVIVSCDAADRAQRQQSSESESRARTVAKLAGSEPGFIKGEDSLQVQRVSPEQMEQAMGAFEAQEVDG
jgi:hypothetical protein